MRQGAIRAKSTGAETVLLNIKVASARDAYAKFGQRTGLNGQVPFRATISGSCLDCCFPYFTVPEGFYATVASLGKQQDYTYTKQYTAEELLALPQGTPKSEEISTPIWPAGCHWKKYCCFSGVRELITKQTVVFDTPVTGVMTKDDIRVEIDVCLQLRVKCDKDLDEDPYNILAFNDKLGVQPLMSQLKDAQAETVRMMARKQTHQTVYGLRAMRVDGSFAEINLDNLNDDEFGREANTVIEQSLMDAMNESPNPSAPSAPDMNRKAMAIEMTGMSKNDDVPLAPDSIKVETKMNDQDKMTDVMLKKLNKQFNPFGIEICDLQIQDVRLPANVQKTVENKTTIGTSRALEAMNQKHKILQIEYANEKMLKMQAIGNIGEQIEEKGKRMVAEVNNNLARERANTKKILRDTQEQSQSKINEISANTDKHIAELNAKTQQILALPMYTPDAKTAIMCGGVEFENKEIVAENAAQLINDYTKGEVQKNLAEGSLKVAKINNETDQLVAQLDARTATVTNLPMFLVDEICATKCGRPDWTNKSILAENVARMFFEHAKAEVDAMNAKAMLEVAQANSDSNKAVYAAEGKAAKSLHDRRAFELAKRQIGVYKSMVNNSNVSFMGADDNSMMPNMVTVHNNKDGEAPWDAVKQLSNALTERLANGGQGVMDSMTDQLRNNTRR